MYLSLVSQCSFFPPTQVLIEIMHTDRQTYIVHINKLREHRLFSATKKKCTHYTTIWPTVKKVCPFIPIPVWCYISLSEIPLKEISSRNAFGIFTPVYSHSPDQYSPNQGNNNGKYIDLSYKQGMVSK